MEPKFRVVSGEPAVNREHLCIEGKWLLEAPNEMKWKYCSFPVSPLDLDGELCTGHLKNLSMDLETERERITAELTRRIGELVSGEERG